MSAGRRVGIEQQISITDGRGAGDGERDSNGQMLPALLFFFINAPATEATALKDDLQSLSVTVTPKRFTEIYIFATALYLHRIGDLMHNHLWSNCQTKLTIHHSIDNGQSLDRCCGAVTSAAAPPTRQRQSGRGRGRLRRQGGQTCSMDRSDQLHWQLMLCLKL